MDFQDHQQEVTGSSNKTFGLVFAGFFFIITVLPWLFGGEFRVWLLAIAAGFAGVAFGKPDVLTPLNRVWTKFGLLIHKVTNPIILGFIFFVVITPMGIVARLFGTDFLRMSFAPEAESYWIERTPPGPAAGQFKDQF